MREKETLPGICYIDPSGIVQGPYDEWRILEWYRQGFFSNTIRFKLQNDEAQFSLGELVDRFGQENPFASRGNWRVVTNGSTPVPTTENETETACCAECRRNGEKLDALLSAIHRLQNAVDVNSQNTASNTAAVTSLRSVFEESRLSAWKWNAAELGAEQREASALQAPLVPLVPTSTTDGVTTNDVLSVNGTGGDSKKDGDWDPIAAGALDKSFSHEAMPTSIVEAVTASPKATSEAAVVDSMVTSELQKITQSMGSVSVRKGDPPKSSPLLERIRKRGSGDAPSSAQQSVSQQSTGPPSSQHSPHQQQSSPHPPIQQPPSFHPQQQYQQRRDSMHNGERRGGKERRTPPGQMENDWINANTRPFHPFPTATNPNHGPPQPPPMGPPHHGHGGPPSPWPNLGLHNGHGPNPPPPPWAMNPFSPLQRQYMNPPSPPCNPATSFAAATLKKEKENNVRKQDPLDEGGPRMVPVRSSQRMVMRRAPLKK